MPHFLPYDRAASVHYAHIWAYGRNPVFYDYETIGGDCTNFVSQCLYAGGCAMNHLPDFGWYYRNANDKAPAWTGVEYLYRFLTRPQPTDGPVAEEVPLTRLQPGDIIQLSFDGMSYHHSPLVVAADQPKSEAEILVAAHSYDADNRPLSTYPYVRARFLHILGGYRTVSA